MSASSCHTPFNSMPNPLVGTIEAGGTKMVCAVSRDGVQVLEEVRFPTTDPRTTFARAAVFFDRWHSELVALAIGAFGPVCLNSSDPAYGYITTTPKPGWAHVPLRTWFAQRYRCRIAFTTDVGIAALGEALYGATRDVPSSLYLTVGTGIGGALVQEGTLLGGLVHPEVGHIRIPRHPDDTFRGVCPFHGDCLEGLASGPALAQRFGSDPETWDEAHPAWTLAGWYLGQALATFTLCFSPHRIVLGGGVSQREVVIREARQTMLTSLAGYVAHPALTHTPETYVVPAALGQQAGVIGGLALARALAEQG